MSKAAAQAPAGKPVALYLRRSTSLQDQSIGSQRDYLTRYAAEHGLEVVREYLDDAVSGTSVDGRSGFQRLIADAQGKADFRAVLCYDVKRFSRGDLDEVGHYRFLLRQKGIEIIYAIEDFGDDFAGDLLRPIRQVMARQESVDLSKATLRGHLKSIHNGWHLGGVAPHGYDFQVSDSTGEPFQIIRYLPDGTKHVLALDGALIRTIPQGERLTVSRKDRLKLVPNPERAEVIRTIYRKYVEEDLGDRAITSWLNQQVASPRKGQWGGTFYDGHWGAATVRNILTNETYTGTTLWNRRAGGKFHKVADGVAVPRERHLSGVITPNHRGDWIVIPSTHEAIIDRATFEAAQKIRRDKDHTGHHARKPLGRGRYSNFMLTGLITCTLCGHKLQGYSQKIRRGNRPEPHQRPQVYLCGGCVTKGRAVCRRHAIDKDEFERFILQQVHGRVMRILDGGGMNLLRAYIEEELIQAVANPKAELGSVEKELARLKADTDRLLACLTPVNREFVDEKLIEIKRRRRELENRREALGQAASRDIDVEKATSDALAYLQRFRDVVAGGTFLEQKEFVRCFVQLVSLDPAKRAGVLEMHNVYASAFKLSGWTRPRLYRG